MPRRLDDDDDDAPRWEPPAPSTEAPTWESPSADVPRWDPGADVPRWQPEPDTRRPPPAGPRAAGARVPASADAPRAAATPPASAPARGLGWWRTHPWLVVWAFVLASPLLGVALRLLDAWGHEALMAPVAWLFGLLFVGALALAAAARARRSVPRLVLGLAGAIGAAVVLVWPVLHVTFGRTACPARVGPDLGVSAAATALEDWRGGITRSTAWRGGRADDAWLARTRQRRLTEFSLVDSGCWERVAPVDGSRTWHEFRVTVHAGQDTPLSKTVVVHTERDDEGWKITAIEGPLP